MAFTESELNNLVVILQIQRWTLDALLTANATYITSEVETDVRAELTRWTTAGVEFVKFTPTESNRGFNLNSDDEKANIRQNIAMLLGIDLTAFSSAGGRLIRG